MADPKSADRGSGGLDVDVLAAELAETWRTNQRINVFLLEHIPDEALADTLSKRGGRDVARQFAHLHSVRVWHLEKRARDLAEGLEAFPTKVSPSREELIEALEASAAAVVELLLGQLRGTPRRRGFKRGVFTTLAYFVSHESHHRGSILLTLKQCGHRLDNATSYKIWDWDRI